LLPLHGVIRIPKALQEETMGHPDPKEGPLDGSTSGTIGGGGAETGGPTARPKGPAIPPANPDDAASGRMAPDPLGTATPDEAVTAVPDQHRQS
jgi:hypothetical protein